MELFILVAICLVSLFIIPLGLPGLWVMIAAAIGYSILLPKSIGIVTIIGITLIAVVAEVLEFTLTGTYAKKYGGSRRASWGAIIGGTVGAIIGVPIPIIGPIIGGFAGAFIGALVFEYSRGSGADVSTRVAWGALVGKAVAAAMKVAAGFAIATWLIIAAMG
jgi:uncharacterized protein YqgC (DUF456 family)